MSEEKKEEQQGVHYSDSRGSEWKEVQKKRPKGLARQWGGGIIF